MRRSLYTVTLSDENLTFLEELLAHNFGPDADEVADAVRRARPALTIIRPDDSHHSHESDGYH